VIVQFAEDIIVGDGIACGGSGIAAIVSIAIKIVRSSRKRAVGLRMATARRQPEIVEQRTPVVGAIVRCVAIAVSLTGKPGHVRDDIVIGCVFVDDEYYVFGYWNLRECYRGDARQCDGSEHTSPHLVQHHDNVPQKSVLTLAPRARHRCTTVLQEGIGFLAVKGV